VAEGDQPFATPLPLVLAEAEPLQLLGHLDANNPAADLIQDGRKVLAIFHGPNAYISPTDMTTKQLPTYNYQQVFVRGKLTRHVDLADVQADIHALVRAMESKRKWDLESNDPRLIALLPLVVGFRIEIESISGRFKVSQDKIKADRDVAMRKLLGD